MAQGIQPTSNVSKSAKLVTTNKKRKSSVEVTQDSIATIPAVSVSTAKVTAAKRKRRRKSAPTHPSTSTTTNASPVSIPVPVTYTSATSRRRRSSATPDNNIDSYNYSMSSAVLDADEDGVVASPSDKPDTTATDVLDIPAPVCAGVGEVYKVTTTTDEDDEEDEEGMAFDYESIFDNGMLE